MNICVFTSTYMHEIAMIKSSMNLKESKDGVLEGSRVTKG